jgi:hypothetical protein
MALLEQLPLLRLQNGLDGELISLEIPRRGV